MHEVACTEDDWDYEVTTNFIQQLDDELMSTTVKRVVEFPVENDQEMQDIDNEIDDEAGNAENNVDEKMEIEEEDLDDVLILNDKDSNEFAEEIPVDFIDDNVKNDEIVNDVNMQKEHVNVLKERLTKLRVLYNEAMKGICDKCYLKDHFSKICRFRNEKDRSLAIQKEILDRKHSLYKEYPIIHDYVSLKRFVKNEERKRKLLEKAA